MLIFWEPLFGGGPGLIIHAEIRDETRMFLVGFNCNCIYLQAHPSFPVVDVCCPNPILIVVVSAKYYYPIHWNGSWTKIVSPGTIKTNWIQCQSLVSLMGKRRRHKGWESPYISSSSNRKEEDCCLSDDDSRLEYIRYTARSLALLHQP